MRRFIRIISRILVVTFLLNVVLFANSQIKPTITRDEASVGTPFYFVDDTKYWSEITDFAVCDNQLFILYQSKKILACYDLDGNYLHSYSFDMMDNGQSHLYCFDDILYFEDTFGDYYSFSDGRFADYFEYDKDTERINALENSIATSYDIHKAGDGSLYEIRGASIWKTDSEGNESKIIHRASWLIIFQNELFMVIHGIHVLLFICICLYEQKHKQTQQPD